MEKNLYSLPVRSIKEVAKEEVDYIDARRKGLINALKTPWAKYNSVTSGIEWFTQHTFGGASGAGKTALLNALESGIIELNPEESFDVLSFNFEMLARNLVGRKYSKELKLTIQELHSGKEDYKLGDDDFNRVLESFRTVRELPIYYVDQPGTVDQIKSTIFNFAKKDLSRGLIVTIDHVLLCNGRAGQSERIMIMELNKMLKAAMKYFKSINKNFSVVLLSQLNRGIEEMDRIGEPGVQNYPKKRDIFGADSIYQFSDVVTVLMNPHQMGLDMYGPNGWDTKGKLFMHILKNREGESKILLMKNKLHINVIEDCDNSSSKLNLNV